MHSIKIYLCDFCPAKSKKLVVILKHEARHHQRLSAEKREQTSKLKKAKNKASRPAR